MAQPRHSQPEVQRQSVKPPTEQKDETPQMSEEMTHVALFDEMVKKIDEIYQAALKLENTPQLAKLLGEVGIVKVTIVEIIAKLKEEEEMRKDEEMLMAARAMEAKNG